MENKKSCLNCKHSCKFDDMLWCNAMGYDVKENEYCPNFVLPDPAVYPIYLTELEIHKVVNLVSIVLEPLKKAANKAVIPKQKQEAQKTLDEVKVILNKFIISYEEGEKENVEE